MGKSASLGFGMVLAGTVCAVGPNTRKLKAGDYVCCVCTHHLDTAVILNERDCEILMPEERTGPLLGQIHPLIISLHVAGLLRLDRGNHVLIDCQQVHLAYVFAQVVLLEAAGAHVTLSSDAGLGKLQQLGDNAKLIGREEALKQASLGNYFDVVLTDANDGYQLLVNVVRPGGRIIALGGSPPSDMIATAGNFLRKSITIGSFDPMDGLATNPIQQWRATATNKTYGNPSGLTQSRSLLAEALDLLRCGVVSPIPCERFDLAWLPEAVSRAAQDDFVGGVILTRTPDTRVPVHAVQNPLTFDPEASYLLVGCLGGLGRSLT
jgi:NADPH:quinone reductase-like Zn-dependent oxidoreductase